MLVKLDRHDTVAVVTLNRPEAMNALSSALRAELAQVMRQVSDDDSIRVVVLTGAGERAFCAGLDLKELGTDISIIGGNSPADAQNNPVLAFTQCRKPLIGAINGVAVTGGFELALACDLLIASENARFADTHARIGIMPLWGLSQKLSRIIGVSRAKELSLTGNFIGAVQAEAWGLVNRVVPQADLLGTAIALAQDMASIEPDMAASYKALVDEGYALPFGEALAFEVRVSTERNSRIGAADVEARRQLVTERGRTQA